MNTPNCALVIQVLSTSSTEGASELAAPAASFAPHTPVPIRIAVMSPIRFECMSPFSYLPIRLPASLQTSPMRINLSAKRLLTEVGQGRRGAAFMPLHASTIVLLPNSRDHLAFPSRSGINAALLAHTLNRAQTPAAD